MITHRGIEVHAFECDLIVSDRIILELKALPDDAFAPVHYAQLINYLKCWKIDLGMLVNFGSVNARIKRIVRDEPVWAIQEDYLPIKSNLTEANRIYLRQMRQNILAIGKQYGLGYFDTIYRKIIAIEMEHSGLKCRTEIEIPVRWDGANTILTRQCSAYVLVEDGFLLNVRSLLDCPPKYDFAQMKTFLRNLGLEFGVIVNFGKKQLQIYAVNPD